MTLMRVNAALFIPAMLAAGWQVFVDADDDLTTGYGRDRGAECVIRSTDLEVCGSGGWGDADNVLVVVEWYGGTGEFVCDSSIRADVYVVAFDADLDGDVDVEDYLAFSQHLTGPQRR